MVAKADSTKTIDTDVDEILRGIHRGRWQQPIQTIREKFQRVLADTGDLKAAKLAIDAEKKRLSAILFSGKFSRRANDALIQHSGLLCADLDGLNIELPLVRQKLSESARVFSHFLSPSGDGVKVLFRVPADASRHVDSFRAISHHVLELTGRQIDGACKDVARLCFASFDPDLYINERAVAIAPLSQKPKRPLPLQDAADLRLRQRSAVDLLGQISWNSDCHGILPCPGPTKRIPVLDETQTHGTAR